MGGSSSIENEAVVQQQEKQAKDAERKENERKARIKTGLSKIGKAFSGEAVLAPTTHQFDWKKYDEKTVLPKGWSRVQVDAKGKVVDPAKAGKPFVDPYGGKTVGIPSPGAGEPGYGGSAGTVTLSTPKQRKATADAAAPKTTTMIMGPDGKLHKIGEKFTYTTNDPTGEVTGGFDQAFYDKYTNAYTDYYGADIAKQKAAAQDKAMYALARAGTGVSTAASTVNADIEAQNTANIVGVRNQADTATGALKSKVEAEKQKAIAQLYATEDPDVASNTALAAVRNLSVEQPSLTPLAQVFNVAAVGGANLLRNYNNQKAYNQFDSSLPSGAGSGRVV